jgi:hypothetical protein
LRALSSSPNVDAEETQNLERSIAIVR